MAAEVTNLEPQKFITASMTSLNNVIGSEEGVLEFEFKLINDIPENGKIKIKLPIWNPQAPSIQQQGIFSIEYPTCRGIQNL